MFSNKNIRFSASYPPSPESLKKKSLNLIKLEYIFYTMTLDCKKKILMQQNGGV